MFEYMEKIDVVRVNCENLGFGPFSVLIVPVEDENAMEDEYTYYLIHKKYALIQFMFEDAAASLEEAAERAYYNAPDYIPDFIRDCFKNE